MNRLSIIKPDDWHLHLRDSPYMESVVADSARQFSRAIVMPNLNPPVRSCDEAYAYRQRILSALADECQFQPLMTLYLTDNTSREEIVKASKSDFVFAAKLYPAGATTNSDAGVTDVANIYAVLETMQTHSFPLLVHGEATGEEIDVFDREKVFIDRTLNPVRSDFPVLPILWEAISMPYAI